MSYDRTRRINKKYFYILKNRPTFDSKTNIIFHRYRGLFSKTRIDGGGAIESNDGRHTCAICARIAQLLRSLDLVRCQSNLFMGLQRIEISDTNLDRGEFIYFWIGDFIQPSCRLFPGTRIRFHGREIFSLDFGTREQPRNKTLRFSSPLKFMRGGFRYRQPHLTDRENWELPEIRIRGVLHRECMITSSTRCTLSCKYFLSNRNS